MKPNSVLLIFILLTVVWLILGRPYPQDLRYHDFANQATVLGVPNAANVLSNLPFVVVGLVGLAALGRQNAVWKTLWFGLLLTGFGSAYYHWSPNNSTLVWDRLPMATTFAGVICIFLQDALRVTSPFLWGWLAYSVGTVIYWALANDLRPYIVLQFGGMLLLAGLWLAKRAALPMWGWVLLGYVLAKILEGADHDIWTLTHGYLAGHAWKHIAAAVGFIPLLVYRRRLRTRGA